MRIIRHIRAAAAVLAFMLFTLLGAPHLYALVVWHRIFRTSDRAHRRRVGRWQTVWCRPASACVRALLGIRIEWSLPPAAMTRGRPVIVISNHQSSFDIVLLKVLLDKLGYWDDRWVIKRQVLGFPVLGRSCLETACAGLTRSKTGDDLAQVRRCAILARHDGANVLLFPEGTRYTGPRPASGFVSVLPPKTGGFRTLRQELPDHAVLSVTIRWDERGAKKTIFNASTFVGRKVRIEARFITGIAESPDAWLTEEWRRKDAAMRSS